jgi:hypothetical protein
MWWVEAVAIGVLFGGFAGVVVGVIGVLAVVVVVVVKEGFLF